MKAFAAADGRLTWNPALPRMIMSFIMRGKEGLKRGRMAEDPIKLFSRRSERYPEADDGDLARKAVERAIEAVPGGSIVTFVLSEFLPPALERRRDKFLKDLAEAVERLEQKGLLTSQELVSNEPFVTAIVQATRAAIGNHRTEKLEALRSAVLNTGLGRLKDEDEQQLFLQYIDDLTPSHLAVLKECQNGTQQSAEDFQQKGAFYAQIIEDLSARGLLSTADGAMHTVVIGVDGKLGERATDRGNSFLEFIADPLI